MTTTWRENGFTIFIWSNENDEPIHFHITKGKKTKNCPKFWLTSSGVIIPDENNRYSSSYRRYEIMKIISLTYDFDFKSKLINTWQNMFGRVVYKNI